MTDGRGLCFVPRPIPEIVPIVPVWAARQKAADALDPALAAGRAPWSGNRAGGASPARFSGIWRGFPVATPPAPGPENLAQLARPERAVCPHDAHTKTDVWLRPSLATLKYLIYKGILVGAPGLEPGTR
jgi:hypothetical protein